MVLNCNNQVSLTSFRIASSLVHGVQLRTSLSCFDMLCYIDSSCWCMRLMAMNYYELLQSMPMTNGVYIIIIICCV